MKDNHAIDVQLNILSQAIEQNIKSELILISFSFECEKIFTTFSLFLFYISQK